MWTQSIATNLDAHPCRAFVFAARVGFAAFHVRFPILSQQERGWFNATKNFRAQEKGHPVKE
jgi:hypothetical protein